ncbi:unnamed protein product [Durusdinium trenchii]|uniref:SMP-30/Gluconolactonase/LRE-like region domain-containing protein n=1 Tax=Durusdinium trenchii TaxID=1381693 RepID=A0ABP0L4A4_9DINO
MGCAASVATRAGDFSKVVPHDDILPFDDSPTIRPVCPVGPRRTAEDVSAAEKSPQAPTGECSIMMVSEGSRIWFEGSEQEQVDFDEKMLASYRSFEWPDSLAPSDVALPPGRLEHELNSDKVRRFMREAAEKSEKPKGLKLATAPLGAGGEAAEGGEGFPSLGSDRSSIPFMGWGGGLGEAKAPLGRSLDMAHPAVGAAGAAPANISQAGPVVRTNAVARESPDCEDPSTVDDRPPELTGHRHGHGTAEVLWFRECSDLVARPGVQEISGDGLREDQNQPMSAAPSGAERVSCPIRNVKGCLETCKWPADVQEVLRQISVEEESLFPSPFRESRDAEKPTQSGGEFAVRLCSGFPVGSSVHDDVGSPHAIVVVIHAAFLGVRLEPHFGTRIAGYMGLEELPSRPATGTGFAATQAPEYLPARPATGSVQSFRSQRSRLLWLATLLATGDGVSLQAQRNGFMSMSTLARSVDYFNPTFVAPQLTPKQFLIISSPSQQKIVYTELKNFKSTTGRTFALIDSGLVQPEGLALDHDRGALYVADKGAKKILRFHVYVQDKGNGLQLITDNVQLCIMQNADTSWVNVDINGDVFYSDATTKTINRIPVGVVEMMAKGQYSASDLNLISEKTLETGGGATSNVAASRFVFSLYDGAMNPHVGTPAGLVSDGARLYWTNMDKGKKKGSVVQGEVSPKLPSGSDKTASFPSTMLSNASDIGYGMTKWSSWKGSGQKSKALPFSVQGQRMT